MKALLFDFDGTLADTLPICYYAFQSVFREFDKRELASDEIKAMFGPSETGIIRGNLIHADKDLAIEHYYRKYQEKHSELVEYNKEIHSLLKDLKAQGVKLAIVTGKAQRSLDISLVELYMDGLFDVVITGDDVNRPKPHPEGILKALNQLGIEKQEALFFGDSNADIQAGKGAEVHTIGVRWLPTVQSTSFSITPNQVFTDISEVLPLLEEWAK